MGRMTGDRLFVLLAAWAAVAGTLLGNGIVHGWPAMTITGAVMSAICPGGVVIAWLAQRRAA